TRSRSISARWINRTSWYPPMSSGSSGGKPGCRRFRSSVAMLVTARPPGGVRTDRGPALAGSDAGGCGCPVENRSEEHTSELQSRENLVCRLLLEKKNQQNK